MHFSWKLILLPIYCILNVWLCDSLSRGLPQRLIICFWINTNVSVSFSCVWIWKITEILKNNFRKCWESITEQHDFNLQIILQLFYNTRSRLKCSYECKKKKTTSFIPIFRNHPGIFDFSFFPGADVSWVETFCCTRTCSEINTPLWEWNHKLLAAQQSRFMTLFTTALLPGLIQTASNNCKHYIEIIAGTKTKVPENTRFCFFYQGLTRLEHRQSYQESLS